MNKINSSNEQTRLPLNTNIDSLAKYTKLYFILGGIGGIAAFLGTFNILAFLFAVSFGVLLAWLIISFIAHAKTIKLNFTKYPLANSLTEKQFLEYLNNSKVIHPEINFNKGFLGIKFTYQNVSVHTISLNEEKKTYSISSDSTKTARLKNGGKTNSIKLYRHTIQAIPIIQRIIEQAANSVKQN